MAKLVSYVLFLSAVTSLPLFSGVIAVKPEVHCNKYIVGEGESLTCECRVQLPPGGTMPTPPPSLSWPGHSNNSNLTLTNVQRRDNGTVFTCLMQGEGMEDETVDHTLFVACGPSQNNLIIENPTDPFITDGSRTLALSCEASDAYPEPYYGWGGLCESNKKNCTCRPQPDQDSSEVRCTATNKVTLHSETKIYTVHLSYPPREVPVIVEAIQKTVLSFGDNLTCTVYGGKPLVSSVNFYCTNPPLPDQPDRFEENSVSSTVIVNTTEAGQTPMLCYCSAVWDPAPELYAKPVSAKFHLNVTLVTETQPGTGLRTYAIVILALMVVPLVLAAVVILYIFLKRRQSPRTSGETTGAGKSVDKRQSVESVGSTWSGHSMTVLV